MAKSAYVVLNADGTVARTHSVDITPPGTSGPAPTTGAADVEKLISNGYLAKREVALDGGRALLVMEKP